MICAWDNSPLYPPSSYFSTTSLSLQNSFDLLTLPHFPLWWHHRFITSLFFFFKPKLLSIFFFIYLHLNDSFPRYSLLTCAWKPNGGGQKRREGVVGGFSNFSSLFGNCLCFRPILLFKYLYMEFFALYLHKNEISFHQNEYENKQVKQHKSGNLIKVKKKKKKQVVAKFEIKCECRMEDVRSRQ